MKKSTHCNKVTVTTVTTDWLLRRVGPPGGGAVRLWGGAAPATSGAWPRPRASGRSPWQLVGPAQGPLASATAATAICSAPTLPAPRSRCDPPSTTTPVPLALPPEAALLPPPRPPWPDLTGKQFRRTGAVTHRPACILRSCHLGCGLRGTRSRGGSRGDPGTRPPPVPGPAPPQVRPPFVVPQVGADRTPGGGFALRGGFGPGSRAPLSSCPSRAASPTSTPFSPIERNLLKTFFHPSGPRTSPTSCAACLGLVRSAIKEPIRNRGSPRPAPPAWRRLRPSLGVPTLPSLRVLNPACSLTPAWVYLILASPILRFRATQTPFSHPSVHPLAHFCQYGPTPDIKS